jgi:predicted transcriptional regulator
MVQIEKSMPMMSKAERSDMPVMMPGSAMGSTNSNEIVSRPKNLARDSAAAASVPKISASTVAIAATSSER